MWCGTRLQNLKSSEWCLLPAELHLYHSQGSHTICPAYQMFPWRLITVAKLQLWSSNENNYKVAGVRVTTMWGTILKGCSIWKVEPYSPKASIAFTDFTSPQTGDQVFKYRSLWETFLVLSHYRHPVESTQRPDTLLSFLIIRGNWESCGGGHRPGSPSSLIKI